MNTFILTALAMIAFAANSVLCRWALGDGQMDAASFSTVRVVSGAVFLLAAIKLTRGDGLLRDLDWRFGLALCGYIVFFSFAYVTLSTGTGALILFGFVQFTMLGFALWSGERFPPLGWLGLIAAAGGIVYLLAPGVSAPDATGAIMMAIAGISWGIYSLLGKSAADPLRSTGTSFLFSVPIVVAISLFSHKSFQVTQPGLALAIASGAVASGCGYVIWYAALKGLRPGSAATVQLSVPIIAAIGGAVLVSEPLSMRLVISTLVTLGGIALVLSSRRTTKTQT